MPFSKSLAAQMASERCDALATLQGPKPRALAREKKSKEMQREEMDEFRIDTLEDVKNLEKKTRREIELEAR